MSFFNSAILSGHGMSVQREVMDIISENLANVNTVEVNGSEPYRRKIPIIGRKSITPFADLMNYKMMEVTTVTDVEEDQSPPRLDYDPTHPLADENGYVKKPNINVSLQMVQMIDATRAYEASVAAFNASKDMAMRALQIGA